MEHKEMKDMKSYTPNPRYLIKLRVVLTLSALSIVIFGLLFALLISLDSNPGAGPLITTLIFIGGAGLFWIPAMLLSGPYFRSMRYEIHTDEVIVHVGIWTQSVKHVPYRTVTNITVQRDILDRWVFNIGTLKIQTAGMSGQRGAEENLKGLQNVQEIYDLVATELRRFRGSMAPTAAEMEVPAIEPAGDLMRAVLEEVRAIRKVLEQDSHDE
jgi:membrane protein YdbS with pleckstrin-like domain